MIRFGRAYRRHFIEGRDNREVTCAFHWMSWFGSLVRGTVLLAFLSAHTFRVEELVRDNHCVIRAVLPGLDPAKDIEVIVDRRTLTIHAEPPG